MTFNSPFTKIKTSFVCFILFSASIIAQDAKPDAHQDSLQAIIDSNSSKEKKKEALFLLGEYLVQRNPNLAESIAKNLKTNFTNKDDSTEIRRNYYIFAASHRWQGDYRTALDYYRNIYSYSKRNHDSIEIAKSAHFIGTLSMFLGNNVTSQKNLIEAADIYKQMGSAKQKARINNSLAGFYLNIDKWEEGKEQYLKALKEFEVLQDSTGMASVNANLGMVYTELGDYEKAEMHLMKQKELNVVFPTLREMGFHHDFLGNLRQKEGKLHEAHKEHLKALHIRENLSSTYNLCESKLNMGEVLIKLNRYSEAIEHLKGVFKYDEHESLYQQQRAYDLLAKANEKKGNFKKALHNFKSFKTISDSIYSKESIEIIAEKDAQYNKQQNDAEIVILSKEKEVSEFKASRSSDIAILSLIGLAILLIAAIALYKMYSKIKQKNSIISKALKDRELLLRETHHRVKNSFQLVSSLLFLQSKSIKDPEAQLAIKEAQERVRSMVLIHQKLYSKEQLVGIDVEEYINELTADIFNSYKQQSKGISYQLNVDSMILDVETITPIGLILNELVVNVIKHAFPDVSNDNLIIIDLKKQNDTLQLKVKDNGTGFEGPIKDTSFGIKLINALSKKLKATVNVNSIPGQGTEVLINMTKFDIL